MGDDDVRDMTWKLLQDDRWLESLGHVWTCVTMFMWCGKITSYLWRNDYSGLNKPFEKLSLFDFKTITFLYERELCSMICGQTKHLGSFHEHVSM